MKQTHLSPPPPKPPRAPPLKMDKLLAMRPPIRPLKKIRILSMGAGVNTVAVLLKYAPIRNYDYIVFADTGNEIAPTYSYIENYLKPYAAEHGIPWITVRHISGLDMDDYMFRKKTVVIKRTRNCTVKFKIEPIQKFCKSLGATELNPVYMDLGMSADEESRAAPSDWDVDYVVKENPLIEDKLTRNDCYEIIEQHGWPRPQKSGCDFCPFKPRRWFHQLAAENPKRFAELVALEQNDKQYPKYPLDGRAPLNLITDTARLDEERAVLEIDHANRRDGCTNEMCGV